MAKAKSPIPAGFHTITPQLTMEDATKAIAWYKEAFGATEETRALGPDGKVIHATLRVGDSIFMLNDDMMGGSTNKAHGGSPISMWVYVENCDALFNRAVNAGAHVADGPMGQLQDQFWGDRTGTVIDPEGYRWNIATHKEDLSPDELKTRQDEWMRQYAAAHA